MMTGAITLYDERQGVPSASRMLRLKLCPGSYWAEKQQHSGRDQKSNPDAERGRRIHEAAKAIVLEEDVTQLYPETDPEEITEARKLVGTYRKIEIEIFGDTNDRQQRILEKRFWLLGGDGNKVLTGQIDIGAIYYNSCWREWCGLICDYKTGWGDVDEADSNLQMRAYAVLLKANRPKLNRITVAVIAPHQGSPSLTEYVEQDLARAKQEVLSILRAATIPDAPRVAGVEQCKYCPAKTNCEEYRNEFVAVVPVIKEYPLSITHCTPEQKAKLCERLPEIIKCLENWKIELKRDAQDGKIPNWGVSKGKKIQRIKNPQEAYRRVSRRLSADQFTGACSVSLPKLRKIYARVHETTEVETKYHLAEKLAGLIEETETEGQLERIKCVK